MTTTIAIASLKGGVGKSMTVDMLGRHLQETGLRTLAVDNDPGATLTSWSGVTNSRHVGHVLGGAVNPVATLRSVAQTGKHDYQIIPSHIDVTNVAHGLHSRQFNRIEALHNAIVDTGADWDAILIDCPGGGDILMLNGVYAADLVIVPTQPEDASISYTAETIDFINQAARAKHRRIEHWTIATMVDRRTIGHQDGLKRLARTHHIVAEIPSRKGQDADDQLYIAYSTLAAGLHHYIVEAKHAA